MTQSAFVTNPIPLQLILHDAYYDIELQYSRTQERREQLFK
jgi:hypothetical protein